MNPLVHGVSSWKANSSPPSHTGRTVSDVAIRNVVLVQDHMFTELDEEIVDNLLSLHRFRAKNTRYKTLIEMTFLLPI